MKNLKALIRFLSSEYGISPEHVLVHGQVIGKTRCPGQYFDLPAARASGSVAPVASLEYHLTTVQHLDHVLLTWQDHADR